MMYTDCNTDLERYVYELTMELNSMANEIWDYEEFEDVKLNEMFMLEDVIHRCERLASDLAFCYGVSII